MRIQGLGMTLSSNQGWIDCNLGILQLEASGKRIVINMHSTVLGWCGNAWQGSSYGKIGQVEFISHAKCNVMQRARDDFAVIVN